MTAWLEVAPEGALPPGERILVESDAGNILVLNFEGHYYAIEDLCSHDGADLDGAELEGDEIVCPRHGAHFCIRNGKAMSAPAFEDIETFPVRVEAGRIQVWDHRLD